MKPKTIAEKEVVSLSKKTPKINAAERKFMEKTFPFFYTFHYKKIVCLECGHLWDNNLNQWQNKIIDVKCPSCRRKLEKEAPRDRFYNKLMSLSNVFCKTFYVGNFQVFRYIEYSKNFRKKEKPFYTHRYYFEEWIPVDNIQKYKGQTFIIGRYTMSYYSRFNTGDYELRKSNKRSYSYGGSNEYEQFSSDFNLINPVFHPKIQNRGITFENSKDIDYRDLFKAIERFPGYETLLKMGEYSILYDSIYKEFKIEKYWRQVKFALKHKVNIDDAKIWQDYLEMAEKVGIDINQPHIALPNNIEEAHDELVLRSIYVKEQDENSHLLRIRKIKERILRDFSYKNNDIEIAPIISPEDTLNEFKALKHCVHKNEYYNKSDSILLSVMINGEKTETAEYSIKQGNIIQCRGLGNMPTEHHHRILETLELSKPKLVKYVKKLIPEMKQII